MRHLQLAHNRRKRGTTVAEVVANLRHEDRLDVDGLRRLVASINRYLGDEDDVASPLAADAGGAGPLNVESSRPVGATWLLNGLWKRPDIAAAITAVVGAREFRTDMERALFALVANRAITPGSKLAAGEWATHDVVIPNLAALDGNNQALRAMDLLDEQTQIQEAVFFAAAHLLNLSRRRMARCSCACCRSVVTLHRLPATPAPETAGLHGRLSRRRWCATGCDAGALGRPREAGPRPAGWW